jgi:hypothetical protein
LKVPLVAEVAAGDDWEELTPVPEEVTVAEL